MSEQTKSDPGQVLAEAVLSMTFMTDKGQELVRLARVVLKLKDPNEELYKFYLIRELEELGCHMPRLENLRQSILDMSPDELRNKINEIRKDRIIRKDSGAVKKKAVKEKDSAMTGLQKMIAGMSEADRAAFLKELEG